MVEGRGVEYGHHAQSAGPPERGEGRNLARDHGAGGRAGESSRRPTIEQATGEEICTPGEASREAVAEPAERGHPDGAARESRGDGDGVIAGPGSPRYPASLCRDRGNAGPVSRQHAGVRERDRGLVGMLSSRMGNQDGERGGDCHRVAGESFAGTSWAGSGRTTGAVARTACRSKRTASIINPAKNQ